MLACSHGAMASAREGRAGRTRHSNKPVRAGAAKEPLQIRIPVGIKRTFKARAAIRGMEPHELFVEVWKYYEEGHPEADQTGTDRGNRSG